MEREALFLYWLSGNGRGYSHYALTRRAGKIYVMSVSALIRLQCIPILCASVWLSYPISFFLHLKEFFPFFSFFQKARLSHPPFIAGEKGTRFPTGWLVRVTETDTYKVLFLRDPLLTFIIPTSKRSGCSFIQGQRGE